MTQTTAASPLFSHTQTVSRRRLAEALFRHKRAFLLVFGVGLALTLLYIFGSHKKYQSNMSLLLQNARRPEVVSAEATPNDSALDPVTDEDLYSQVEVLGSADILDEVVDPGWHNVPVTAHSKAEQSLHEAKLGKLRGHLSIAPVRNSHVIDVNYVATDPRVATETLNRLLNTFLAREKTLSEPPGASRFFEEQAQQTQAAWNQAQANLTRFQQENHLVSVTDKQNELSQALAATTGLARAADAQRNELARRIRVESSQRRSISERQRTTERTLPAAGSVDQVNGLLAQLLQKRALLLTEYLPTDRLVQQVDSQIAQAHATLKQSQAMNSLETATGVNPTWQSQDQAAAQDRAQMEGVQAREDTLFRQAADLEGQLRSVDADAQQFTALQQQVQALQDRERAYEQKRDAALISEAMNAHGLLNVGVLQSPSYSMSPIKPRPFFDGVLGLLTSFLMACAVVYLLETSRDTIASAEDLQTVSHAPVLASMAFDPGAWAAEKVFAGGYSSNGNGSDHGARSRRSPR